MFHYQDIVSILELQLGDIIVNKYSGNVYKVIKEGLCIARARLIEQHSGYVYLHIGIILSISYPDEWRKRTRISKSIFD